MPGRHSGGSGLGGSEGSGGMRGGGLGGGYRGESGGLGGMSGGGPGWGGGWRGGGGWGGWRGGGGWGWRGMGPFGWGWIMPWTWFGMGGGYGAGLGGIGCAIVLILAVAAIFVALIVGRGGGAGSGYRGTFNNSNTSNNGVSGSGSANGGAILANESPAIQTQTAQDVTELHAAFDNRIATWQTQVGNNQNLSIPPAEAGLTQDNNTQAVLYGKCGSALYVYVVDKTKPDSGPANGEGYVYTTASSPGACHPPQWTVYDSEDVGGGWYFATLETAS